MSLASAFGGGNGVSSRGKKSLAKSSEDAEAGVSSDDDAAQQDNNERQQQQQQQKQQRSRKNLASASTKKDTEESKEDTEQSEENTEQQQRPLKQTGFKAVAAEKRKGTERKSKHQAKHQGKPGTSNSKSAADTDRDSQAAGSSGKQEAEEKLVLLDKSDHPVAKKRDGRMNQQVIFSFPPSGCFCPLSRNPKL